MMIPLRLAALRMDCAVTPHFCAIWRIVLPSRNSCIANRIFVVSPLAI
jgi:hypothetical protein